jgi:hypothetical protein
MGLYNQEIEEMLDHIFPCGKSGNAIWEGGECDFCDEKKDCEEYYAYTVRVKEPLPFDKFKDYRGRNKKGKKEEE